MPRTKKNNLTFTSRIVIENKYQPGAGVGAKSIFARRALRRRAAIKKDDTVYLVLCERTSS